jgi:ABC-2 type transport system ATP-binding protein
MNLAKTYPGNVTAVHPMNIRLTDGVVGLLGPNGAGKTTLMRILATLLDPSQGTALIEGHDIRYSKPAVRSLLGYLPQDFGLYPSLTVFECLDYMGLLAGMSDGKERRRLIELMLPRVNLTEFRDRKVGALSGGMKRRLGVAQAILHDPQLLIFDEPTAGLDPEERIRVRNLLSELGGKRIIILSTHIVADIASTANQIAVMNKGRIIFFGTPDEMIGVVRGKSWQVTTNDAGMAAVQEQCAVTEVQREGGGVVVRFVAEHHTIADAVPRDSNLEDAYMWLMAGQAPGAVPETVGAPAAEVPKLEVPAESTTEAGE